MSLNAFAHFSSDKVIISFSFTNYSMENPGKYKGKNIVLFLASRLDGGVSVDCSERKYQYPITKRVKN